MSETPEPDPDEQQPPREELPVGEHLDEEPRRYPSTIGGLFYLVVLAATAVGITIVWTGNWRLGTNWLAGALIFAALVRLVLPHRDAGMLAVRHRVFDCVLLAGVGGLLIFLSATIPNQPA